MTRRGGGPVGAGGAVGAAVSATGGVGASLAASGAAGAGADAAAGDDGAAGAGADAGATGAAGGAGRTTAGAADAVTDGRVASDAGLVTPGRTTAGAPRAPAGATTGRAITGPTGGRLAIAGDGAGTTMFAPCRAEAERCGAEPVGPAALSKQGVSRQAGRSAADSRRWVPGLLRRLAAAAEPWRPNVRSAGPRCAVGRLARRRTGGTLRRRRGLRAAASACLRSRIAFRASPGLAAFERSMRARLVCACVARPSRATGGPSATCQVAAHLFCLVFFDRRRVGLLFGDTDGRERVENGPALYFQLPCQIIDSNFTHPSLFGSLAVSSWS